MRIYILDPASTEWNRGGYNYLPYLFHDYLVYEKNQEVHFIENFTLLDLPKIDTHNKDYRIYVSFCTPPQKDMCLEIHRLYPEAIFFGYYGFIEEVGFPSIYLSDEVIVGGMKHQGKSFHRLGTVLLSDCDAHINGKFEGNLYPIHTSYACSNGCFFCPGSKNNNRKITLLPMEDVKKKLEYFKSRGWNNIHFVDENLAVDIDRMYEVLTLCKEIGGFNSIVLGDAINLCRFIDKYGKGYLEECGVFLLEVGFEGINLLKSKGGNKHEEACIKLHSLSPSLPFFLTMTFAPGETIETLNRTGEFLAKYGKKPMELVERIRTNGTEGGLGQFFQPYPNLPYDDSGIHSPFNPTRLYPSFIPTSFLQSKINSYDDSRYAEFEEACKLYPVRPRRIFSVCVSKTVQEIVHNSAPYIHKVEMYIMLAIAARLRMIQ